MGMKKLIFITQDMSGMGFAKLAQDQGDKVLLATAIQKDEKKKKEFNLVGNGIVPKIDLKEVLKNPPKDAYYIFDQNFLPEVSDNLRKKGFKVNGASSFMVKAEHDREFGVDLAKKVGLSIPPTQEFKSLKDGLKFLEQNPDKAYVYKPNNSEDSYTTFVPSAEKDTSANEELRSYLASLQEPKDGYVLQERIKGVETNFEVYFYEGKPFFAFCDLENKKKIAGELGENFGCAFDFVFTVPIESKGIQKTIGKFFPFFEKMKYTGTYDVNIIVSERDNYYLETCSGRFGYNSHPNLLMALAKDSFSDIYTSFMDGKIDNFYEHFKYGFGASVSLYTEHPRTGLPIYVPEEMDNKFYHFDSYKKDGFFTSGYDVYVGIAVGHAYTMEEAADEALEVANKVNFPDKAYRNDMKSKDYPNAPINRYNALNAMKYFDIIKEDNPAIKEQGDKIDSILSELNNQQKDIIKIQDKIDSVVEESKKQNEAIRESIKKILQ
jgi:phosphoribosylamine-glycine ligase